MALAPELETERLVLRPFTLDDLGPVFAMSREAGMRRWLPDQVYADLFAARAVLDRLIAGYGDRYAPVSGPLVLGVEARGSGVLVGHVGLGPYRDLVEIGYAIGEAHQGQGLATEAVAALTAWGHRVRGLPEILGHHRPGEPRVPPGPREGGVRRRSRGRGALVPPRRERGQAVRRAGGEAGRTQGRGATPRAGARAARRPSTRTRQLAFDLRTWGGRRKGAGRKPSGNRSGVAHDPRPAVAAHHPVHVTLRVRPHVFNLRARRCLRVIEASFAAARSATACASSITRSRATTSTCWWRRTGDKPWLGAWRACPSASPGRSTG